MFEQLWDNGIDAADRIEDIEGGIEFADIEVIQNPNWWDKLWNASSLRK